MLVLLIIMMLVSPELQKGVDVKRHRREYDRTSTILMAGRSSYSGNKQIFLNSVPLRAGTQQKR